jgi:hypothetical protein
MSTSKPRRRTVFLLLVVGTVVATVMAAAVPTYSLNTRRTGPRDDRGFPLYYTDNRGQALRLCEDGSAHCLRADPGDLVAPNGEALYWSASTTLHSKRGPIDVEFALEAAFGDSGRPIVFDRIRVRGHLNKKGKYVLLHPYGRIRFRAISIREQRNVDVTHDRNCSVVRKGRCRGDIDKWLRGTRHPKGYIGFGQRKTRVKGGTVRNFLVLKTTKGKFLGKQAKFRVIGKKAGRLAR